MVVVHPAFDPNTKTWFTDDGDEAGSLCELKQKIPGVKIVGYYPHGAPPTHWPSMSERQNEACRATMRSNYGGPKRQLEAHKISVRLAEQSLGQVKGQSQYADGPKTSDGLPSSIKTLTEDLVSKGQILPSPVPVKVKPKVEKVLSPVQARQTLKHWPKQKVKQSPPTWDVRPRSSWSKEDDEQLKSLAMRGLSAGVIGRELKVTRNAVIGRAHRIGVTLGRVRYAGKPNG